MIEIKLKFTSESDVAGFLGKLRHILIRFALPETEAGVEVLNDFSGDADVIPHHLLVRCYSADRADAPAKIAIDNRSQLSIAKLQHIKEPIEFHP